MGRPVSHEVETLPRCEQCRALCRPGHALCDQHHAEQLLYAARRRLVEFSADAVDVLLELQQTGPPDVALRAAVAILDRAGVRPGVDVIVEAKPVEVTAAEQIRQKLNDLRRRTEHAQLEGPEAFTD